MRTLKTLEQWEVQQLDSLVVLAVNLQHPMLHDEEIEVEINKEKTAFTSGRMSHPSSADASWNPLRIVKNPESSLQRATLTQSARTKEP